MDDPDNLGCGSSGCHLQTKLSGYQMFFRKQCWHLVNEWTFGLMNGSKYHWCETSLLSQAVLKHAESKDFIFKKSVQGTGSVSCQESRNLWHYIVTYQKIFMSCYITFKRKTSTCGSHLDCSVGQWVKWVNRCDPLLILNQVLWRFIVWVL